MDKKKMDLENAYQTIKMEKGSIKKEENKEIETTSLAEKEKNKLAEMNKLLDNMKVKLNSQNTNNIKYIYGERRTNN